MYTCSLLHLTEKMDEEERQVRATFKSNKYESIFGLEGVESSVSSNLRKSRTYLSKQSLSGVRSSIASKFFSKKDFNSVMGNEYASDLVK